jgi:hypothetical protein
LHEQSSSKRDCNQKCGKPNAQPGKWARRSTAVAMPMVMMTVVRVAMSVAVLMVMIVRVFVVIVLIAMRMGMFVNVIMRQISVAMNGVFFSASLSVFTDVFVGVLVDSHGDS